MYICSSQCGRQPDPTSYLSSPRSVAPHARLPRPTASMAAQMGKQNTQSRGRKEKEEEVTDSDGGGGASNFGGQPLRVVEEK